MVQTRLCLDYTIGQQKKPAFSSIDGCNISLPAYHTYHQPHKQGENCLSSALFYLYIITFIIKAAYSLGKDSTENLKRISRIIMGIFFLTLGVLGLFLPVLQGILFLIIGLLILAPESNRIQRIIAYIKNKYPAIFEHDERIKRKLEVKSKN